MSVYKWPVGALSEMREVFDCEFEDLRGVTAFLYEPFTVRSYISDSKCLAAAMNEASIGAVSGKSSGRLYMGATAGMRAALRSKPILANQLMSNISVALEDLRAKYNLKETKFQGINLKPFYRKPLTGSSRYSPLLTDFSSVRGNVILTVHFFPKRLAFLA